MNADVKKYWRWVVGLTILELLSWMLYHWHSGLAVGMVTVAILACILAWKKPSWLAYLTIAELIIGGKGYLFSFPIHGITLSIREVLFFVLLVRFLPLVWRHWKKMFALSIFRTWAFFTAWVVVMVGWGIVRHNGLHNVFFDANAFAALAYLPLWWVSLTAERNWRQDIFSLLLAASSVVALKSLIIVFCFGHSLSFIGPLYHWVRDTGIGEITWINSNVYRVFLQSQVYDLIVMVALVTAFAYRQAPRWWWCPLFMATLGTYISLSRSFWLGGAVALLVAIVTLIFRRSPDWWRFSIIVPLAVLAWLLTSWATNFPAVFTHGQTNAFISRLSSSQSVAASTARVNQFQPLLHAIWHDPILGSGFGTSVTYFSTDPRVHGWRTTTAFELGYLDLWLKMGLIGLGLYGWWVVVMLKRLRPSTFQPICIGVIALIVTHITSPYLNHPLGLSWLALASLYAYA